MWEKISVFVLRNRLLLIVVLAVLTGFMAYQASYVELQYDNPKFIPDNDPDYLDYQNFKSTFGDDGSVLVIGINSDKINTPAFFNEWCNLSDSIEKSQGIEKILSISNVPKMVIGSQLAVYEGDTSFIEVFNQERVVRKKPTSQKEVDSLLSEIKNLRFYQGILVKDSSNFTLMAITLKKNILDSKKRIPFVEGIVEDINEVCEKHGVEAHYSGLPYIRTRFSSMVQSELLFFTALSMAITALILLFFFRSLYTLIFSMLVVAIGVVWSFGILVLLGYKITPFIGLLPPLIVVIGIANCIYLLNKYHDEYKMHNNKMKALQRVISRVGIAVFFTNLTTGIGFGVFILTGSTVLKEFGLTAFLSVMSVFAISIVLIPLIFSYLPKPTRRQTKHLDNKILNAGIKKLGHIVTNKRKQVYMVTAIVIALVVVGMSKMKAVGFMVDDISKTNQIYKDLKFFEENVRGVMPFEIVVDSKVPFGIQDPKLLRKINDFETNKLSRYTELSRSISIAQIINFARQELNGGNPDFYRTPNNLELSRILQMFPTNVDGQNQKMVSSLIDSTRQKARISVQMADVGSKRIEELKIEIAAVADSVFNYKRQIGEERVTDSIVSITQNEMDSTLLDTNYFTELIYVYTPVDSTERKEISLTGTSIIFLKGNNYLNTNLMISLLVAFLVIGLIMATIFTSARMIAISLIPNIIPLMITAGLMGYFHVALKPSTVLVFSIAFGIAVDFTIHFLSKYRMELNRNRYNIQKSVSKALNETGVSMVYTSVILFFGFIIFSGSSFGGTIALGVFTSLTLIVALLTNLILLPSLLLSYDLAKERAKRKKSPLIEYPDEEA